MQLRLEFKVVDAGIIIAGRWGTLHEFTSLVDFNKVIGVLVGTGGIADELPSLYKKVIKAGNDATIIFEKDPKKLVRAVFEALNQK